MAESKKTQIKSSQKAMRKKILDYEVLETLGEGGMGTVYKARDPITEQMVAVKELHTHLKYIKEISERFRREAKIMAKLNHTNIVKLLRYAETDGGQYVVMEYLEGKNLEQYIRESGPIGERKAAGFLKEILKAFGYAHENEIVHRDIKASNVFITREETVKIMDFGIGKILGEKHRKTRTGQQIGTVIYMSPEQVEGRKDIDERTDIYSIGVMLHEMVTGKAPYDEEEDSEYNIQTKILKEPLPRAKTPNAQVSEKMQQVIDKATEKDREKRFQSCGAFSEALERPAEPVEKKKGASSKETKVLPEGEKNVGKAKDDGIFEKQNENVGKNAQKEAHEADISWLYDEDEGKSKPVVLWGGLIALVLMVLAGIYFMGGFNGEAKQEPEKVAQESSADTLAGRGKFLSDAKPESKRKKEEKPTKAAKKPTGQSKSVSGDEQRAQLLEKLRNSGISVSVDPESLEKLRNSGISGSGDPESKPESIAKSPNKQVEMVFVKGGTFMMGSEDGDDDEKPVHQVTVSDFYIGKYEVTQKLWKEVMGSNPSSFKGDDRPVEYVSWHDVQEFIRKLNKKTGGNYRLPTEAEWEYAARGGAKSRGYKYAGSNNIGEVAEYVGNNNKETKPVGGKKPNELGIYDMSGNVWEWCSDWYGDYSSSSQTNPTGPSSGSYRVLRGGSWNGGASRCRVACRNGYPPTLSGSILGFRLVSPR